MKKFIFITFAALALLSCQPNHITEVVEPFSFTERYVIAWEDWRLGEDDAGIYYFYEFREPALTRAIFDRGIMQAFMSYRVGNRNTLSPLPFSDFRVDRNGYRWEEHFTVEFQVGFIRFIMKIDDHSDIDEFPEIPLYDEYEFLVRFLW